MTKNNTATAEGALGELCKNFRFFEFTHHAFELETIGGKGYEWTEMSEDGRITLVYFMRLPNETPQQAFEATQKMLVAASLPQVMTVDAAKGLYGKKA
jgi:hypothetical protein